MHTVLLDEAIHLDPIGLTKVKTWLTGAGSAKNTVILPWHLRDTALLRWKNAPTGAWFLLILSFPNAQHWQWIQDMVAPASPQRQWGLWADCRRFESALHALQWGASAYLPRSATPTEIHQAWVQFQHQGFWLPARQQRPPEVWGQCRRRGTEPAMATEPISVSDQTVCSEMSKQYIGGKLDTHNRRRAWLAHTTHTALRNAPDLHWASTGQPPRQYALQAAPVPAPPKTIRTLAPIMKQPAAEITPATPRETPQLSPRKNQISHLMHRGLPYKVIAQQLGIAEDTVKDHAKSILRVFGCRNRLDLILRSHAAQSGYPAPDGV